MKLLQRSGPKQRAGHKSTAPPGLWPTRHRSDYPFALPLPSQPNCTTAPSNKRYEGVRNVANLPARCAELSTLGANRKARYACILETGRGFFERVCAPCTASAHFRDPPPTQTHTSRMVSSPGPPQRRLAAANLHSLLRYLVP